MRTILPICSLACNRSQVTEVFIHCFGLSVIAVGFLLNVEDKTGLTLCLTLCWGDNLIAIKFGMRWEKPKLLKAAHDRRIYTTLGDLRNDLQVGLRGWTEAHQKGCSYQKVSRSKERARWFEEMEQAQLSWSKDRTRLGNGKGCCWRVNSKHISREKESPLEHQAERLWLHLSDTFWDRCTVQHQSYFILAPR